MPRFARSTVLEVSVSLKSKAAIAFAAVAIATLLTTLATISSSSAQSPDSCQPRLPNDAVTVQEVTQWRDIHRHDDAHVLRWNRVLAALGEDVDVPPMTVEESRANEGRFYWTGYRWARVTLTLYAWAQCDTPTPMNTKPAGNVTPEVSIMADPDITEGGIVFFTVTANPPPSRMIHVPVTIRQNGDFLFNGHTKPFHLSISPERGIRYFYFPTINDDDNEPNGSVIATLGDGKRYTVAAGAGSAKVGVADNDAGLGDVFVDSLNDAMARAGEAMSTTTSERRFAHYYCNCQEEAALKDGKLTIPLNNMTGWSQAQVRSRNKAIHIRRYQYYRIDPHLPVDFFGTGWSAVFERDGVELAPESPVRSSGNQFIVDPPTLPQGTKEWKLVVTLGSDAKVSHGDLFRVYGGNWFDFFSDGGAYNVAVYDDDDPPPPSVSVVFVIDDSGSMDGDFPEVRTALEAARDETVDIDDTNVALISFGKEATTLFGLTEFDSAPWDENIAKIGGGKGDDTHYKPALMSAKALLDSDDAAIKKIVFMSGAYDQNSKDVETAIDELSLSKVSVDTVYFGSHSPEDSQLRLLSTGTGGLHRDMAKSTVGTVNDPAVEPETLNAILTGAVGKKTSTLFLIDTSHSQHEGAAYLPGKFTDAIAAAYQSVEEISSAKIGVAQFMGPSDIGNVKPSKAKCYSPYRMLQGFRAGLKYNSKRVEQTKICPSGSTDLNDALVQAYNDITNKTRAANKRVVVITDGITTDKPTEETLQRYIDAGVRLDVVAFGSRADRVYLKSLADTANLLGDFHVAK